MSSEHIKKLAETYGVALQYENARGDVVSTDVGMLTKLLENMGVRSAVGETDQNKTANLGLLPPVVVVRPRGGW